MSRPAARADAHDEDGEPIPGSRLTYGLERVVGTRVYRSRPDEVHEVAFYYARCPNCRQRAKRGAQSASRAVQAFADLHWHVCPARTIELEAM